MKLKGIVRQQCNHCGNNQKIIIPVRHVPICEHCKRPMWDGERGKEDPTAEVKRLRDYAKLSSEQRERLIDRAHLTADMMQSKSKHIVSLIAEVERLTRINGDLNAALLENIAAVSRRKTKIEWLQDLLEQATCSLDMAGRRSEAKRIRAEVEKGYENEI